MGRKAREGLCVYFTFTYNTLPKNQYENWQTPAIKSLQILLVIRMLHWKTWYVVSWSTIHFPRVDYSSYCTPANVGLGPASQAPVRETYVS